MIRNRIIGIIAAVLTFIVGSILFISIIFYIFGYPLSSIPQHQLYVFFGVLLSAVLASLVYGRGSKERSSNLTKYLNESLGLDFKQKDIMQLLRILERFPPFLLQEEVSKNINLVESLEGRIEDYKSQMANENLLKIRKILELPIPDLQKLLHGAYLETNLEQFKILADPNAEPFIIINLQKLKKILFND